MHFYPSVSNSGAFVIRGEYCRYVQGAHWHWCLNASVHSNIENRANGPVLKSLDKEAGRWRCNKQVSQPGYSSYPNLRVLCSAFLFHFKVTPSFLLTLYFFLCDFALGTNNFMAWDKIVIHISSALTLDFKEYERTVLHDSYKKY